MRSSVQAVPTITSGRFFRDHPTIVVSLLAFAPIVLISALGWRYAGILRDVVPVELTNLDALKVLLAGMLHSSIRADSWGPMLQALNVLRGPDRDALYQTLFFAGHVRFQYPPTSLLSLDLLSALGLASLRALNAINSVVYLLNAAAAGLLGWLLFSGKGRVAGRNGPQLRPGGMVAIGIAAAFTFYPNVRADVLGQIQVWIDFLFTCAVVAWLLERRLLAGILIGFACTIKPQFGLLLFWGLLWREWAFSCGILAVFVPVTVVSLFRYGFHAHLGYLEVLAFLSRHGESFFANNSVNGILNGYLSSTNNILWDSLGFTPYHPLIYAGTAAASILALGAIVFLPLMSRKTRPNVVDLGVASICTVIGSPVAWEHHYGILLPIYGVALKFLLDQPVGPRRGVRLACLAVSWILVSNFIPFANLLSRTPFSALQAHLFFGALLLLALLLSRTPVNGDSFVTGLSLTDQRD
jgi:alpha-1,2-mannosyltransferase